MNWIKVRTTLRTSPKVVRISSALMWTPVQSIGAIVSAWMLADEHADDNGEVKMTAEEFDIVIGCPGLADAMEAVGWLEIGDCSVLFLEYQEHNGTTAKRRAADQKRKRHVRKTSATKRTKSGLEKRREEKSKPPKGSKEWLRAKSAKPITDEQKRIGRFVGRRETTPWTNGEVKALEIAKSGLLPTEWETQLEEIERYYLKRIPAEQDYRRRDLITLLNNWTGELDRSKTTA